MSMTGLAAIDTTIHKTNIWLKEIMEELGWNDRHQAYSALRAVLHVLRDRLTVEEAVELGAQLPVLIRGIYYDGWELAGKPVKIRDREEFLTRIHDYFRRDPNIDPERVTRAVFKVLSRKVTEGEISDVKGILPSGLQSLWE